MKRLCRRTLSAFLGLSMVSVLSLPAMSDTDAGPDDTMPNPATSTDVQSGSVGKDAERYLHVDADLRKRIERTSAALEDYDSYVTEEMTQLNDAGHLDRRTRSRIKLALNNARDTMGGMTAGMEGQQRINGWDARMIAYELGMAADALATQANKIEQGLLEIPDIGGTEPDNQPNLEERQLLVAERLRKTSALLRETAHAIDHSVQ